MKTNKLIILLLMAAGIVFIVNAQESKTMYVMKNGTIAYQSAVSDIDSIIFYAPAAIVGCFPEVSDKYVYPIVPGMIEWKQLESTDEAYKLCQLPEGVLSTISTSGLIDALIYAPLFTGFYLLSSNPSALKWHAHYQSFNSARELFTREDAGNALVAYYKLARFDCVVSPVSAFKEYERMMGLEILFTKQEILDKMGHEKKKEAVAALLKNYNQFPDYINGIYPMTYLMFADKYAPMVKYSQEHAGIFQQILEGYLPLNQKDSIVYFAKNYINNTS